MQVAPQRTGTTPSRSATCRADPRQDRRAARRRDRRRARIARVARARSGATSCRRVRAGLAALHGSTPDVSVIGYSLGGGVGWYARKLGLSANSVVAIELVTPDGRFRRVDLEYDPELFWALRGGGGNFGIVTAIEVQLFPIDGALRRRALLPRGSARRRCCTRGTRGRRRLPDEVTLGLAGSCSSPPMAELPEPFGRGRASSSSRRP